MAAELKKELGAETELIESGGGIFDVEMDGKIIYSRATTGRFPRIGEVVKLVGQ